MSISYVAVSLLFTHHYPARCFGMNMQSGMNFGYVTVNGVNSNAVSIMIDRISKKIETTEMVYGIIVVK